MVYIIHLMYVMYSKIRYAYHMYVHLKKQCTYARSTASSLITVPYCSNIYCKQLYIARIWQWLKKLV